MSKTRLGYKKVKWLFGKEIEIPKEWDVDEIQNHAKITTGSKNTQDKINDGVFPFFIRSQKPEKINSYSYDGEAVLTAGDGEIGKIFHYINGKFDFHQRVYKISDFDNMLDGYFFYLFFSFCFFDRTMSMTAKTSVDSIRMDMIAEMVIFLPPLYEQKQIASILSNVDALIENIQKVTEKAERLKKGLMQQLLTRGIGHTKFKKVKWLFGKEIEVSKEWMTKKLVDIGEIIGGGTPNSKNMKYWNGNILWAVPTDITRLKTHYIDNTKRKITREGLANSSAKLLPVGTVLLTSRATIGECAITTKPISTNQGFQSIVCNSNFDNVFTFYLMCYNRNIIKRLSYGTTFLEISKKEIGKTLIWVPEDIKEQQKIASILSGVDAYIQKNQEYKEKLEHLKKGLMQKLLTGQIRVKI